MIITSRLVVLNELIDTLWNVNRDVKLVIMSPATELIDTLWNVNIRAAVVDAAASGINRYIMECKSIISLISLIWFLELIDTLWNVNGEEGMMNDGEE